MRSELSLKGPEQFIDRVPVAICSDDGGHLVIRKDVAVSVVQGRLDEHGREQVSHLHRPVEPAGSRLKGGQIPSHVGYQSGTEGIAGADQIDDVADHETRLGFDGFGDVTGGVNTHIPGAVIDGDSEETTSAQAGTISIGDELEKMGTVLRLVTLPPVANGTEGIFDHLGLVGGREEHIQLGQERIEQLVFVDGFSGSDEGMRIARKRMAVCDGDATETATKPDELGQVTSTVGVAAIGQARIHVIDNPGAERLDGPAEMIEIKGIIGVGEIRDTAPLGTGFVVDEGRSRREIR